MEIVWNLKFIEAWSFFSSYKTKLLSFDSIEWIANNKLMRFHSILGSRWCKQIMERRKRKLANKLRLISAKSSGIEILDSRRIEKLENYFAHWNFLMMLDGISMPSFMVRLTEERRETRFIISGWDDGSFMRLWLNYSRDSRLEAKLAIRLMKFASS